MLYIFMGQSCTGKTTAAKNINEIINTEVYSGKDYLRMAKVEADAWRLFYEKLINAAACKDETEKSIIYVITEKEHLARVTTIEGAIKVKFTASLEQIKSRFAERMRGNLPQPVEKMLEKQYAEWENVVGDINIDTSRERETGEIIDKIIKFQR